MTKQHKRWIRIAECRNIPLREGRAVRAGGHEIAIFNLGGRFLAVENRCPHKGGPLSDGIVSGTTVVCPLHSLKLNLETGETLKSDGVPQCVQTFRARIEDGIVAVEFPVEASAEEEAPGICVELSGSASWLASDTAANG